MQQVALDDVIVRVMKCVIYNCLPSGRGCAAGSGTGYKSNEIMLSMYNSLPSGRGRTAGGGTG